MNARTRLDRLEQLAADAMRPFNVAWLTPGEQRQMTALWDTVKEIARRPEFMALMVEHVAQLLELGVLP